MSGARTVLGRIAAAALVASVIATAAVALQRGAAEQQGPRPIEWGKEPCAHCRMLIGEPAHAAQVVLADGSHKSFDDPGCLLRYLETTTDEVTDRYFHHGRKDTWLRAPAVAFVRGAHTPMGFGLLAVEPGATGAVSLDDAAREVSAAKHPHREGAP